MENEIVAYEVGANVNSLNISKKEGFTTHDLYLGHCGDIPVYRNNKLKENEIKQIMKTEYKDLPVGNYDAFVERVYSKKNKDDANKECISIELTIKGRNESAYKTFFMHGYSEMAMKVSQDQIDNILQDFNITALEQLKGQYVKVSVKQSKNGYSNMYINPIKSKHDGTFAQEHPCHVIKFYEKNGKYMLIAKIKLGNEEIEEFIPYRIDNEGDMQSFDNFLSHGKLTREDVGKDINIQCIFAVNLAPSKKDPSVTYTNKKIKFPRTPRVNRF